MNATKKTSGRRVAAIAPDVADEDRRWLEKAEHLPDATDLPLPTGLRAVGVIPIYGIAWRVALIATLVPLVVTGALPIPFVILGAVGVLTARWCWDLPIRFTLFGPIDELVDGIERARRHRVINRCEGRYLLRSQLDPTARQLFDRAVTAINTVQHSTLAAHDLIDAAAARAVFAEQRWALAHELARQSRIRRQLDRTMGASPGEYTAAVAAEQRAAVADAAAASDAQVEALERYAEQVRAADATYRDRQRAHELAATNGDTCLDLLAGTAGTAVRTADLDHLAEQLRTVTDAIAAERAAPRSVQPPRTGEVEVL